jgi:hypothetical protein
LPDHNRVENEVGMMLLFRQALANHHLGHLIPDVYGWGSAEGGQGWILQEFKHGSQLDRVFETASDQLKQSILTQMADIVYAMQAFEVPQTVTEYGGVSFSPAGELVSGPMTTLSKGPFQTYAQSYKVFFEQQLTASDKSPVLNGWQEDGLRARLMRFCADQLPDMTSAFDDSTKMIAHSDFSKLSRLYSECENWPLAAMNNMLIDESTGKLTALLDFDWSFIGSFHDEFLRSFGDLGMIPGPDAEGDELILRQALLSGQNDQHNHEDSKHPLQDWYKILKTQGARIPSDISGMEEASQLHWFVNQISPWLLTHEVPLKRRSKEQLEAVRATRKQAICSFLDARGL